MNGQLIRQEEVVCVQVTSTTSATCSSSASHGPPGPRRVRLVEQRGSKVTGPLKNKIGGGEFCFELIENYPTIGLSAVQDGSGSIINHRGKRPAGRGPRCPKKEKEEIFAASLHPSQHFRTSVLDPFLPNSIHMVDLDLVSSSLNLKNYPVCDADLFDVNSKFFFIFRT